MTQQSQLSQKYCTFKYRVTSDLSNNDNIIVSSHIAIVVTFLISKIQSIALQLINSKVEGHHLELPVLVYNEVLNSGWCKNVPILIHSEQLERIEKGLLAMSALSGTCSFSKEVTRLKELVENFSSIRDEPDVDIEYTEHLLKHCRSLLRYIRTQNSDL